MAGLLVVSMQHLRLGLNLELAQLLLQAGDGAREFREVEIHQAELLFEARARDAHLTGMVEQFIEQLGADDFDWLMAINFDAVVRMTRAFMPLLSISDDARIVNVSSIYGIVSPPGQTAYSASKFAVRGFSNALRHELEGTRVGVTVVHPGGVATAIARSARAPANLDPEEIARRRAAADRKLRMPPARAGEIIVRAVERRRARVLVGADAVVVALLERLLPVSYWSVLRRLIGD